MGSRRSGRIVAFVLLYRYELSETSLSELLDLSWIDEEICNELSLGKKITKRVKQFASLLIVGCLENIEKIDMNIRKSLQHWDINRVSRVDLSLIRLGVYCLLYQSDIPSEVTIDESVSIAREFGGDDSYRFVNGVLDNVYKHINSAQISSDDFDDF